MIALLWVALIAMGFLETRQIEMRRIARVSADAKGFSEYVGLQIMAVDRVLSGLRQSYQSTGALADHAHVTEGLGPVAPLLLQVAVANSTGDVVASTLPMGSPVSIADRPHFRAFVQDPTDRLHFSQPVVGRVSGRMSWQLVRPLLSHDGSFKGVIVASLNPQTLQNYFDSQDAFTARGAVQITGREDGIVRVRFEKDSITWGQNISNSSSWPEYQKRSQGALKVMGVLTGTSRLLAFQQVAAYPFFVLVSVAAPQARDLINLHMGAMLLAALLLTGILVMWTRSRVRLQLEHLDTVERLTRSEEREAAANRMKSNFLASVSHELRTPLNSILGFSELIRDESIDETTHRYADLIHTSAHHLHSLVNTLLDLAKIEAGRMEVRLGPVDMAALLKTVTELHRVNAEKKGVQMSLHMPDEPLVLNTDRTKVTQVLNNIMHNAVKFTESGAIWVTASTERDELHVQVVDSGVGIPADKLPRVFDRFSIASGADIGAGLGLSLSRELMTLLGGSIELRSEIGSGTEVHIRIPGVTRNE